MQDLYWNEETRPLATDEPAELEEQKPVEVGDCMIIIYPSFYILLARRGNVGNIPQLIKERKTKRKLKDVSQHATRLDSVTLESRHTMHKKSHPDKGTGVGRGGFIHVPLLSFS